MSPPVDRGSVSIVAVSGVAVLCLFSLAAADLGAMLHARATAQAAADAAAIAAALASAPILGQGDDPEAAARAEAQRNGATLLRCACEVPGTAATVEVEATPRPVLVAAWFGRRARATATAELDPDIFSYRDE